MMISTASPNRALSKVLLGVRHKPRLQENGKPAYQSAPKAVVSPTLPSVGVAQSILPSTVCRQSFWFQRPRNLSEYLAHLVDSIMRRFCGVASAGFRAFCV
jgi:hypothetical protein